MLIENERGLMDSKTRLSLAWRIGLVLLAVTLIWQLIGALAHASFGPDYSRSAHILRAALTSLMVIPLIAFAYSFLDRRSWDMRFKWRPLLVGMLCWLVPASIGLLVCVALGWTEITLKEPIGTTLLFTLGLMFLVFLYEALPEELIFRSYFYQNLASVIPRWLAPFAASTTLLNLFYKQPNWHEVEADPTSKPVTLSTNRTSLQLKGINYDTGTNYVPGYISRELWTTELIQDEIRVIRHELNCNAINIFGSDIERLRVSAIAALEEGLQVWLQPRLIDSTPAAMLAHLSELASMAEQLRKQYGNITLNVGCELSIFMSGLIPGQDFLQRVSWLTSRWWLWMFLPHYNRRLDSHLKQAFTLARSQFNGQITYGAAIWENVDWALFDVVGLNYYREASNWTSYAGDLQNFHRYNKPIVITEFGCCSFDGADQLGAGGDSIIDYAKHEVKANYSRNEKVQADYLLDLLTIYQSQAIHGAFVFEFTEPSHPYSTDPRYDLDRASYGIVKVYPPDPYKPASTLNWEPKQAFYAIANFYNSH